MPGPLTGYSVVEFADGLAGPFCAMQLGDGGMDVVKVEHPRGDRSRGWGSRAAGDLGATFLNLNRNKRSIAVDFGAPDGVEVVRRLVDAADVVICDAGWTDAADLQPDAILRRNPQAVVLCISGFGAAGPWAGYPPYSELGAQMASEATKSLGVPGEAPVRIGNDNGAMFAAVHGFEAICAALLAREDSGGQRIDVSPWGSLLAMRSTMWAALTNPDEWWGFHLDSTTKPPDTGYHTRDGAISFTAGGIPHERRDELYQAFDMEWVKDDPLFKILDTDSAGGSSRYGWLVLPLWERVLANFTTAEVFEISDRLGLGQQTVKQDYEQLVNSPQARHVGLIAPVEHPGLGPVHEVTPPWEFSDTSAEIRRPAPRMGEHGTEILAELRYSSTETADLLARGAVVVTDVYSPPN